MAQFALLWKANTVEKYRLKYENEKINSISMADIELPKKTVLQKWRHYRFDTQKRISKTFRQLYPEGSSLSNFIIYLKTKQTYTNIFVKSIFGFVGGYVLSYFCFIFFVYQLSISIVYATVLSFIIGILLTLGLAFSYRIRCLVFLLIPQFFSRFGRYTLTCYALVLILTGPATNTLKNSEVLSESMACSQEQIKTSLNDLNQAMLKPHNFLKDSIKQIVEKTKKITSELKEKMIKIKRLTLSIVSAIQNNFAWLQSIASNCNHKLGTPYQHCTRVLKNSITYCEEVSGAVSQMCYVTYLERAACADTKTFEAFCGVSEFVDDCFLATVRRRLKDFSDRIKAMMHLKVTMHHSYSFSAYTNGSASQVAAGIVTEIRNRADPLLTWLSWSSCVTSLFLLLIIFRAKYYQHMYETRSRFDNRYVTKELRDLDFKRQREGRETILPLNRREKAKYINITSFRLLTSERMYWSRSIVFMTITTFKLLIHMVADYSLYWVLVTIRYHGSSQTPLHAELPRSGFHILSDVGFVARFIKSILSILEIPLTNTDRSTSCLPNPNPPDFRRYTQIGVLIFLLWFFALFEPYGLRLRHVIMSHYRPERARERAVWLYNHILRTRGSFLKFARRKLHREYKYRAQCTPTYRCAYLPCNWLCSLFGTGFEEVKCVLCGTTELKTNSDTQMIRCKSMDCPGTYCSSCFTEIGQLCTICLLPEDYGDISDISLERGSSGESSESDDDNNEIKKSRSDTRRMESSRRYKEDNEDTKNNKTKRKCNNPTMKQDDDKYPLLTHTCNKRFNIPENAYNQLRCHGKEDFVAENNLIILKVNQLNNINENHTQRFNELNERVISYSLTLAPYDSKRDKNVLQIFKIQNVFHIDATYKIRNFDPDVVVNAKPFIINTEYVNKLNSLLLSSVSTILLERFNFYEIKKENSLIVIKRTSQRYLLTNFMPKRCRKDKKMLNSKEKNILSRNKYKFIKLSTNLLSKQRYIDVNNGITTLCFGNKKRNSKKAKHRKRDKKKADKKQKRKCKDSDEDTKLIIESLYGHIKSLNTICTTYINIMKPKVTSCNNLDKVKNKFPSCDEKKNHKRRKKLIRIFNCTKNQDIKPKDSEEAQKFRISAYFSDQEWFKRMYGINSNLYKRKHEVANTIIKASEKLTSDNSSEINQAPPAIQMAKCTSSGLLKLYNPKTECSHTDVNDTYKLKKQRRSKLNITKKALERFRYRIAQRLSKGPSTKNVTENVINAIDVSRERDGRKMLAQTNSSINRRVNYFRSIVNEDLDNIDDICEEPERIFCNCDRSFNKEEYIYSGTQYEDEESSVTPICDNCQHPVADSNKISRESSRVDTIGNNRTKCACNKLNDPPRSKTPLKFIKQLCTSIFGSSADEETHSFRKGNKASKGVNVVPKMKSVSCQHSQARLIRDHTTQIGRTPTKTSHDAATTNINPTCTCATQRTTTNRNVGTWLGHHCNELHRAATEHKRKILYKKSEALQPAHALEKMETYNINNRNADDIDDTSTTDSVKCLKCKSSIENNDSKTDITICSIATVDYRDERRNKKVKTKTKVVTKTNRSTLTDKAKVCDVSTITNDWWSPIVERKEGRVVTKISLKKKKGDCRINEVPKRLRNRGMTTDGRIVTFRSRTQVIPPGTTDIMSPSRYLLESQKYYNELFSSKYYTPHMYMITETQKHQDSDKNRSPASIRQHTRRRPKNKIQEECLSKRSESIKIVDSPRKRVQANIFKPIKLYRSTPRPHHGKKLKDCLNMKLENDTNSITI